MHVFLRGHFADDVSENGREVCGIGEDVKGQVIVALGEEVGLEVLQEVDELEPQGGFWGEAWWGGAVGGVATSDFLNN